MDKPVIAGKKAFPFPNWMKLAVAIVGFGLLSYGAATFFSGSIRKLGQTLPYTFIGLLCLFTAGFHKQIYLTEEGLVKEYRTWGSKGKDLIPWVEIKEIFIREKGEELVSTFHKDDKTITIVMDVKEKDPFLHLIDEHLKDIPRNWVE